MIQDTKQQDALKPWCVHISIAGDKGYVLKTGNVKVPVTWGKCPVDGCNATRPLGKTLEEKLMDVFLKDHNNGHLSANEARAVAKVASDHITETSVTSKKTP